LSAPNSWALKRDFERLSETSAEAAETLARLNTVTSLCRLIGASVEKRLWEGLEEDLAGLRVAVAQAGAIARGAPPRSAQQRLAAAIGCIPDPLRAVNECLDRGVQQVTAKLAAKTAANMVDVLGALARMEAGLAGGGMPLGADASMAAGAFGLGAAQLAQNRVERLLLGGGPAVAGGGGGAAPAATAAVGSSAVLAGCPICAVEQQPGVALGCGDAAHALCMACTLRHARAELCAPRGTMVHCPLCAPRDAPISEAAVMGAHAWAAAQGVQSGDLRPLSLPLLGIFATMQREREGAAERARSKREAEARLPEGLFKRCPGPACGVPVQHARGHHCHHIAPGTGCTQCGTHFCYACLRVYLPGEDRIRCPNGCGVYCDARCDCPDCAECKPGRPCAACDNYGVRGGALSGRCWVCEPEKRLLPAPPRAHALRAGGGAAEALAPRAAPAVRGGGEGGGAGGGAGPAQLAALAFEHHPTSVHVYVDVSADMRGANLAAAKACVKEVVNTLLHGVDTVRVPAISPPPQSRPSSASPPTSPPVPPPCTRTCATVERHVV
jgi:hypothetical protein